MVAGTPGEMIGAVPDGVDEVTIKLANGSTITRAVNSNVYHAPAEGAQATFLHNGREQRQTLNPISTLSRLWPGARVITP
jgi:hypothetical protein